MKVLYPPLAENICSLYEKTDKEFILIAPWLKKEPLKLVIKNGKKIKHRVLIAGNLNDFIFGSTDISAIEMLYKLGAEIRLLENLHAKIYVRDNLEAIITSANLTSSGLLNNIEIGVHLDDINEIENLKSNINEWFEKAKLVDNEWIFKIKDLISKNLEKIKDVQNVQKAIEKKGIDLKGPRIKFLRRKSFNLDTFQKKYRNEIEKWVVKKCRNYECLEIEDFTNEIIKLFYNLIKPLKGEIIERTWFGIHYEWISLTTGGIWLGAIWIDNFEEVKKAGEHHSRTICILVDEDWDFLAKSTKNYIPLGWKILPWNEIIEINKNTEIWESYKKAIIKVLKSPQSKIVNRRNIQNKISIKQLFSET